MLKNRIAVSLFFLLVAGGAAVGAPRQPVRDFFGLRLGMGEESAHQLLRKIATQETEGKEAKEGGEQEVWVLKRDSRFKYLLVKFNRENRLSWLTVVAHPRRVRYSHLGSLKSATKDTDGINYSYKWKVEALQPERPFLIIARGSSPTFLTSYSVYPTR